MSPTRFTLSLALAASIVSASANPVAPLATPFAERASLMQQCADYVGAADQLHRFLTEHQHLTSDAQHLDEQASISLMQALLLDGRLSEMRDLYSTFMLRYSASPLAHHARALLADSYFFAGDFRQAAGIYSLLPIASLPAPFGPGTQFRYALTLLKLNDYHRAADEFASLLDEPDYNGKARFYLAYIAYLQEDYRRALADLQNLPPHIATEMGADFYIAQILFQGKRYAEVLGMERSLLAAASRIDADTSGSLAEAYRLLGESAHATGAAERARAWLVRHVELHPDGGELSARYLLGAADYAAGFYTKAAEWMQPVASLDNAMGQSALLYLGQCAARLGDYSAAAISFDRAARMNYDSKVAETALYNYAAAQARGGNVPFGSATDLLETFARKYPSSPYAPAVDEYLATAYYREHRYAEAIARISRLPRLSTDMQQLRQRAAFDLGADLLASSRASEARKYLEEAANSTADRRVSANARLWLGDCLYRLKEYNAAIKAYDSYLSVAERNDPARALTEYNRAYARFQLGKYADARKGFQTALNGSLSPELKTDATLRIADCRNFTGDVQGALDTYRQAAAMNDEAATDYAIFQTANMLGVLGRNTEKAAALEKLLRERPESSWCSAALAELADAQQASGNLAAARATIARLEQNYPDSEQLRIASLSLADALADKGKTDEALEAYEALVRRWPTSPQARVAAENLQNICTERGLLTRYLDFIRSVPQAPQPDADRVARLAYQAAMNLLEKNPRDLSPLEKYVADYPAASDTPDALASLADDYMTRGDKAKALAAAERILTQFPHSKGVPSALMIKGNILTERGDNAAAAATYKTLLDNFGTAYARQAYDGLLRTATEPKAKVSYATALLSLPEVAEADRNRVRLLRAEALTDLGQYDAALADLKSLASDTRTATGGRAAVLMAGIYMKQNQPTRAEELMTKFTAAGCDDMETLARGYIALADAYAARGRRPLARQYLEALRENYPQAPAYIKSEISSRLSQWK